MSHFYKSKTQEALERVRQKHGLAKATTDNTKSETKSDKGKQNNSAPSAPKNESARITNQSQVALERIRQSQGLSEKKNTVATSKSNGNTKPVDASEGFKGTYTPKTTTTKTSGTTTKYTDYTTETKNSTRLQSSPSQSVKDYSSAVKYLKSIGVHGASGVFTEDEWRRRNKIGGTYQNYLDSVIGKYENNYEYYKSREEYLRPIMEEISNDWDRLDPTYRAWVENYEAGLMPDDVNEYAREKAIELSKKFKYQDAIIAEYKAVSEQLAKFEHKGIHYTPSGEVDTKAGKEEAKYVKERYDAILNADALTDEQMVLGFSGELPEEEQKKYDERRGMAGLSFVEAKKINAYDYYDKNKDKVYDDNMLDRFTGNYKVGRIGIKSNDAGYASYAATTDDIEASEVYQLLSERIQNNNKATFQNNSELDELISMFGQYAPQAVDQIAVSTVGKAVGKGLGALVGGSAGAEIGGRLGSATLSANYMYKQTAGASFVRLLQKSDLSVEDAKKLAGDEALSSAAVEFGLDFMTSKLFSKVGSTSVVKNTTSTIGEKLTKALTSKGISEKGAKIILNVAKNAGKLALHSAGEGTEEWWQEGISITADKYAAEGKVSSPYKLLLKSLDVTQYSEKELSRMNQSFLAGAVIGFGQGGLDAVSSYGLNKTVSKIANAVDETVLGKEIINSGEIRIVADSIEIGKESNSPNVVKLAEKVENAIKENKTPSAKDVGTLVKSVLTEQTAPATLEQAAMDVVASRNATQTTENEPISRGLATEDSLPTKEGKAPANVRKGMSRGIPLAARLEAQSRNNEPLAVEDVQKATGLGEHGSNLIAELANTEGMTFSQAERAVKTAYMAGFANVDGTKANFVTDTQIDAFAAGKKDRVMQDLSAKESAKNAAVNKESGFNAENLPSNVAQGQVDDHSGSTVEAETNISPEEARRYNIMVSNLKRNAENMGLLDANFFTALQDVNLYNPTANDRALIASEFRRVFADNTDPLVASWLDGIGVDTQSVTSMNEQNMHVNNENGIKSDKYVTEIPESVTKPPKSVIKKADSVTETVESEENTSRPSPEPEAERYDIPEGSEIVNNIVVDEHSKRLKRENPRAYSNIIRMARRLGMNVRFVKNLTDENGKVLEGLITSKGIFINADAKNPSRFVATHEFGHRMKQAAPKVWAKYQEYVINKLKRESFDSGRTAYDVLYEETKNAYGKDDPDSINEEIAVNYAGELFDSEEMLESFIREDKSLALRVRDWWYNVLESMGLLSEKKKAQQLWLKAYTAAGKNVDEGKVGAYSGEKFKYVGETDDGRKIYRTNYKEGTPKSVKQNDLIDIIQNIWSKKPIHLAIKENGVYKEISANFNPELSERSDLSKIVFGNRKGNGSEKRMTLDLSTDLYQIASDAKQTGSKAETGKDNKAHDGVKHWYYFITNLVYEDVNGKRIDCYMNIDVKENQYGHYFYSFAIEKGTAPQTLLAVVSDDMSPTVPTDTTISQDNLSVNSNSMQNTAENAQEGKKSIAGTRLSELVEKYGAIPAGENPARDVAVPKKTSDGRKVSQTVRTILEAKVTPDEAVPSIEELVTKGEFSYGAYTDKEAIAEAEETIAKKSWETAKSDWYKSVGRGDVSKKNTAEGWAIYNNAVNIGEMETALEVLNFMVKHQRSAAQALQATRILKKLSPETQLYGVQKSITALQEELKEKYGDKAPDLKIDEKLAENFLNAKTEEERLAAEIEIYKDVGRQVPSDLLDMWNAWRYVAMLTNLLTHGRNILGNLAFAPIFNIKNIIAAGIEAIAIGKKPGRTKSLLNSASKVDRELISVAYKDYANVADIISNGGKYSDGAIANKYIEEGRAIFTSKNPFLRGVLKPIEWTRKGNSKLLEVEDMWFAKPHYAYALALYCKANNITAEQLKRGRAIAPAREYAIKEAQKATYRDTNAFSQTVSSWGRGGKNKNGLGIFVEGALPFRKTPANVFVRGVEYSPLGLLNGLSRGLVKVSKGEMTAAEVIDNISAGLTGTGLLALGVLLAALGFVRGRGEGEEEEKEFEELMGHQDYSLELPNGQSATLDWLAPASLPFFTGVRIFEAARGKKEDITASVILEALNGISDPMLEMSFVQGLNDIFESVGYASSNDTSGLVSVVSSAVTSYLTQAIPTIFGQIERTGEENRMTTYTEKNSFLTGDMQYTLGKISAKIPVWDYNQIPYIDAWGRKEASGTALKRGFNNFLNPAYTSEIEDSNMEKELLRLYERTGEGGVFPERADKYFTVDGVRKDLTADEYVRYATLKGQKSYKLVSDLVNSKAYKKLSDEEKVKAVKEAYEYANQKAKQAISNYKPESWVNKADEFGSNVGNYISFKAEVSNTEQEKGGKISKSEVVDIILDMAQNDSETWKMYLSKYDAKKDLAIHSAGIGGEEYMNVIRNVDKYDKPNKSGNFGTYTNDEIAMAIKMTDGLTKRERAILWQEITGSTSTKNNPWRSYLP